MKWFFAHRGCFFHCVRLVPSSFEGLAFVHPSRGKGTLHVVWVGASSRSSSFLSYPGMMN